MIYTQVKNPVWANAEKTLLDCLVTFETLGEVPFTASLNDTDYAYEIFIRCSAGEFGPVGEYVAPVIPPAPDQPVVEGIQTL